ncbi:MAG: hypothetical protein ACT443_08275, partial [Gemmatimonadota bacterium]
MKKRIFCPMRHVVLFGLIASLGAQFSGCTDRPNEQRNEAGIDTLPSGAIEVRNSRQGAWDAVTSWKLEPDLRIGSPTGPDAFSSVEQIAVDAFGRMFILDRGA